VPSDQKTVCRQTTQVCLVSLLVAAALSGLRSSQVLLAELVIIDPRLAEAYDYEGARVFEHVYVPFRDAQLPDGSKLSIYFDTATNRSGNRLARHDGTRDR
jgi:hypothetical protein